MSIVFYILLSKKHEKNCKFQIKFISLHSSNEFGIRLKSQRSKVFTLYTFYFTLYTKHSGCGAVG